MSQEMQKSLAHRPGLYEFIVESLRIEGIYRNPTVAEYEAHDQFLRGELNLNTLLDLQAVLASGKPLRDQHRMDVQVGGHRPLAGGPEVRLKLQEILSAASDSTTSPWHGHVAYEKLHPFMDGNGRTGRAVWAWQMQRHGFDPFSLPFLHRFYYQTLGAVDRLP